MVDSLYTAIQQEDEDYLINGLGAQTDPTKPMQPMGQMHQPGTGSKQPGTLADYAPSSGEDYSAPMAKSTSYTPETATATDPELVSYQVQKLLEEDSPYLKGAETRSLQQQNQRGLLNTAMTVSAGEKARIDAALPIAQQDAETQYQHTMANQAATNRAMEFGASAKNDAWQQWAQQMGSMVQNQQANDLQRNIMSYESDIRKDLAEIDQQYAMELETLTQQYNLTGEITSQAGQFYADGLLALTEVMSNTDLTPEQQREGIKQQTAMLSAGLQFLGNLRPTGGLPAGGTIPAPAAGGTTAATAAVPTAATATQTTGAAFEPILPETTAGALTDGQQVTQDDRYLAQQFFVPNENVSNELSLGAYPGQERIYIGTNKSVNSVMSPVQVAGQEGGERTSVIRTDVRSGIPTLVQGGSPYFTGIGGNTQRVPGAEELFFRPEGWSEENGTDEMAIYTNPAGEKFIKLVPIDGAEVQERWFGDPTSGGIKARLGQFFLPIDEFMK